MALPNYAGKAELYNYDIFYSNTRQAFNKKLNGTSVVITKSRQVHYLLYLRLLFYQVVSNVCTGHGGPGVCLSDSQTEAYLKDMGMAGLASAWAMVRRRPI